MAQMSIFDRTLRSMEQKNYEEFIQWIDILGEDQINVKTQEGYTLLSYAAELGDAYYVSILIDHNADVNSLDNNKITPLMIASGHGHITTLQTLLQHPEIDINLKDVRQNTALTIAIFNRHLSIIVILLDKHISINISDTDGWTPLMYACQHGTPEIVSLLISHDASLNARNNSYQTPLMIACTHGNTDIAKVLFENGAQITDRTPNGWTSLKYAAYGGYIDTMEFLFEKGAQLDELNHHGKNILHLAGYDARLDACKYLIKEKGMNPEIQDEFGNNVLTNYGMWLDNNDPDNQPDEEITFWRPRLSPEQKTAAVKELIATREAYLLQIKRNENWKRRWPFMKIMVCHDFQPTIRRKELLQKLYPPLPTNAVIPRLPSRTRAQCLALLRDKVLIHPGLWKLIASFL